MAIITVAKTAGFCFGVNRAVNLVYDLIEQKKVSTLGPIIHNSQMVADLESRGVTVIDNLSQAKPNVTVVIRSHGVGNDIYRELEQMKQPFVDATCPFVAKIHKIVERESSEGATIIIAGDENHPEVQGIIGHCKTKAYVVNKAEDLEQLSNNLEIEEKNNCILLAQTTYNTTFWENLIKNAKKLYTNIKIFDTICSATSERQSEAVQLASENNLMVVIGGRHSSNTKKLAQVCLEHCKTVLIETASELSNINLFNFDKIGVTAGASTPAYIIKEVLNTMSEILQNDDEELDFAQLLEQSLETEKLYNGKRVKGIVTTVAANEVHVDIGAKQAGIIPASELSDDPNIKIDELVKKGDELDLCVVKVNDQEGIVTLSKKRCDAQAGLDKLKAACESGEILSGVITDVVRGGVLVFSNNLKVFVPASQVSDKRVENLETLIKTPVEFKVLEVNDRRGRALGSIRAVMSEQRKANEAKIWDSIEVGKEYKGEVKSITSYGAFVDIGGIDGMVHITELSWLKIKHPSEVVSVGDVIDVYIKSLDPDKKRISLGYKAIGGNPWTVFGQQYKIDDVVEAKVVSFTAYGAFAQIIPGVDGLVHISQIANQRVEKIAEILSIGDIIKAKIIDIDVDKKRVSLSMRALLAEDEQKRDREIIDQAVADGLVEVSTEEVLTESTKEQPAE